MILLLFRSLNRNAATSCCLTWPGTALRGEGPFLADARSLCSQLEIDRHGKLHDPAS